MYRKNETRISKKKKYRGRQEAEAGGRRQRQEAEAGGRRQEAGGRRQEAGGKVRQSY